MKKYFLFLLFFVVLSHHCFPQTKSNPHPTKISYFLKLKGQTRIDSIELLYVSEWEEVYSTASFKEINSLRNYGKKTNDDFLSIYSDYRELPESKKNFRVVPQTSFLGILRTKTI